jgi:hypothetical protein
MRLALRAIQKPSGRPLTRPWVTLSLSEGERDPVGVKGMLARIDQLLCENGFMRVRNQFSLKSGERGKILFMCNSAPHARRRR